MISREKLLALYSAMVKYRALVDQTQDRFPASLQLTPGLEAAIAAVTADLKRSDAFVSTGSKLASAFVGGAKLKDLLAAANRKSAHARNGHVPSLALAEEIAEALETAEVLNRSKSDAVSLVFCQSRRKTNIGRKQLQQATRNNLPLIFVRVAPEPAADRKAHTTPEAFAFGVPRIAVDASDVLAVYRVASEAIARARHRRGPTLIDCVDFSHPDTDPIHTMELHLAKKRILNAALKQKIENGITRELNRALRQTLR